MRFGGIVPVVATKNPWSLGMRACPTFIAAISLWVVGIPATVAAEQPQRVPQIGFLEAMVRADYDPAKDPIKDALLEGLQALGYVEGKNIHIEYRVSRKPDDAAEMARTPSQHNRDASTTSRPPPPPPP